MTDTYRLQLAPIDGLTLPARTKEEWSLGYNFRVVFSDLPAFTPGSVVTIEDVREREEHYGAEFEFRFDTLTVAQHLEQRAETDYGFAKSFMLWQDSNSK